MVVAYQWMQNDERVLKNYISIILIYDNGEINMNSLYFLILGINIGCGISFPKVPLHRGYYQMQRLESYIEKQRHFLKRFDMHWTLGTVLLFLWILDIFDQDKLDHPLIISVAKIFWQESVDDYSFPFHIGYVVLFMLFKMIIDKERKTLHEHFVSAERANVDYGDLTVYGNFQEQRQSANVF